MNVDCILLTPLGNVIKMILTTIVVARFSVVCLFLSCLNLSFSFISDLLDLLLILLSQLFLVAVYVYIST